MNHEPSILRNIAVIKAVAAGALTTEKVKAALPNLDMKAIQTSLVALRKRGYVESFREETGYKKRYRVIGNLEQIIEELHPSVHPIEIDELERAMGIPAEVRATLAVAARGRVILGVAGLNARG